LAYPHGCLQEKITKNIINDDESARKSEMLSPYFSGQEQPKLARKHSNETVGISLGEMGCPFPFFLLEKIMAFLCSLKQRNRPFRLLSPPLPLFLLTSPKQPSAGRSFSARQ
jgi:hypothetical protein